MYDLDEEDIVNLLSSVLKANDEEEIDGLEEILPYVSGLISTRLQEIGEGDQSEVDEILEESMVPFLDSVGVPSELIQSAVTAIQNRIQTTASTDTTTTNVNLDKTQKLAQGIVNMSSVLHEQTNDNDDGDESMWSTAEKIKANANSQIDAYHNKTSAREKRKQRQELEKSREDFERRNERQETSTKAGVSAMILPTVKGKEMDVNVQRISLSLENGTCLLEQGDLKFAYQRRFAIIGENGVGKYRYSWRKPRH
jgi:flagellar biosynthesis GTPase FlhF